MLFSFQKLCSRPRLLAAATTVTVLALAPRSALANGENSPVGTATALSPAEVVKSAGSYSANTGSIIRTVPDLAVPGSIGAYPLVFARTSTSRYMMGETDGSRVLGKPGSWRFSYQWQCVYEGTDSKTGFSVWRVHYPDGAVVHFGFSSDSSTQLSDPKSPGTHLTDPYMRSYGKGISERLEASSTQANGDVNSASSDLILHRSDGGRVVFSNQGTGSGINATFQASHIYDPYNQRTDLSYYTSGDYVGHLQKVTDPSGRYLQLTYSHYSPTDPTVVLYTVSASSGQFVNYQYGYYGSTTLPMLTTVIYANEQDASGNTIQATYTYQDSNNAGQDGRPMLKSCNDPHFAGAMPRMRYAFLQSASATYGQIQAEIDDASGTTVSSYNQGSFTETRGDGPTSQYTFDSTSGYLLNSQQDYEGNTETLGYDGNSYLGSVKNRNGHTKTIVREPYTGRRLSLSRPDASSSGTLTTLFDYGSTAQVPYPINPYWLMKVTDPRGKITKYTRDGSHRVTRIDYPDGTYETFSYNAFGQVTAHRKADGSSYSFTYDANGNLTQATDSFNSPNGLYTTYSYDSVGRLSQVTDFKNHSTYYTYNGRHQVTQVKYADGYHVDFTYDKYGNQITLSNEQQKVTSVAYDNYRRPTSITKPVNAYSLANVVTTFSYERGNDTTGNGHTHRGPGTMTLPSGKKLKRVYSQNGRVLSQTKGYGTSDALTDTYTYDNVGHLLTMKDALGFVQQTFAFDSLERKSTFTDANGHKTTWDYYPASNSAYAGWLMDVQRPGSAVSTYATTQYLNYDAVGHVLTTQDPSGKQVGRTYDSSGRLSTISDASGTYTYGYDVLARPASLTFPGGTTQTWSYDPAGNRITYKNRAGKTQSSNYDSRNRLRTISWNDGGLTDARTISVDPLSHMTEVSTATADTVLDYDDAGGVLDEKQTVNGFTETTTYTRDADGNVTRITYPNGDQANYYYDNLNRCYRLGASNPPASNLRFEGERLAGQELGNGLTTEYEYDPNNRIWEVWHHTGAYDGNSSSFPSTNIAYMHYGYEPDNQVSWSIRRNDGGQSGSALEDGRGESYEYNQNGSLSHFSMLFPNASSNGDAHYDSDANANDFGQSPGAGGSGSYCNSYPYDDAGNRNGAMSQMGTSITYAAADGANRYTTGWTYDGNSDATTAAGTGWTYQYDAEGRMTQAVRQSDNATIQFKYDGLSRLVYQSGLGVATTFCYAGSHRIEERNYSTNASIYRYFFIAPGSDRIVYRLQGSARLYYQYDAFGNTTHVSDDSGAIKEQYLYDAYGTAFIYNPAGTAALAASTVDNRYLFHGASAYEYLPGANLYYCRARMYTPLHGRFLQPDPSGFGGLDSNLYRYCHNDPVNRADPSGLQNAVLGDWSNPDAGAQAMYESRASSDYLEQNFSFADWGKSIEDWAIGCTIAGLITQDSGSPLYGLSAGIFGYPLAQAWHAYLAPLHSPAPTPPFQSPDPQRSPLLDQPQQLNLGPSTPAPNYLGPDPSKSTSQNDPTNPDSSNDDGDSGQNGDSVANNDDPDSGYAGGSYAGPDAGDASGAGGAGGAGGADGAGDAGGGDGGDGGGGGGGGSGTGDGTGDDPIVLAC